MNNILALDLGTTKFCLARETKKSDFQDFDFVSVPAQGMRKGMLSDYQLAKNALERLLQIASERFPKQVDNVALGVAGRQLKGEVQQISTQIKDFFVTKKILTEQENTLRSKHAENEEILHVLSMDHKIDDRPWTTNALGLSGLCLTSRFLVISADKFYLRDLVRLCNSCGLHVDKIFAEPLASSFSLTKETLTTSHYAVADIGGGTTDVIVFKQGKPTKIFTLEIGGAMMTHDISVGTGLGYEEAENIKRLVGLNRHYGEIPNLDSFEKKAVLHSEQIYRIIAPRIKEWCLKLLHDIQTTDFPQTAPIFLTGGGSQVPDLVSFLCEQSLYNFKKAHLDPYPTTDDKLATISGMLKLYRASLSEEEESYKFPFFSKKIISLHKWFREIV